MNLYYLDASALVKRYADEPGSDWVRQITDPTAENTVLLAEITLVEVAAALAGKGRAPKGLTREEQNRALGLFLHECEAHFLLLVVDRQVVERAVELTQTHPLRGYDAVQLATALVAGDQLKAEGLTTPIFAASDRELTAAGEKEGLEVCDPVMVD